MPKCSKTCGKTNGNANASYSFLGTQKAGDVMFKQIEISPRDDSANQALEFMDSGDFSSSIKSWDQYVELNSTVASA